MVYLLKLKFFIATLESYFTKIDLFSLNAFFSPLSKSGCCGNGAFIEATTTSSCMVNLIHGVSWKVSDIIVPSICSLIIQDVSSDKI